jgi:hypothetical protein
VSVLSSEKPQTGQKMSSKSIKLANTILISRVFFAHWRRWRHAGDKRLQLGTVLTDAITFPPHCHTLPAVVKEAWGLVFDSCPGAGLMPCPEEDLLLLFSSKSKIKRPRKHLPPFRAGSKAFAALFVVSYRLE